MITGAHTVIYTTNAEADRAFLRDVLELAHVDAGEGWLIFALPPSEVAVHPAKANDGSELYLLTDNVRTGRDRRPASTKLDPRRRRSAGR